MSALTKALRRQSKTMSKNTTANSEKIELLTESINRVTEYEKNKNLNSFIDEYYAAARVEFAEELGFLTRPKENIGVGMCNFDHSIEPGIKDKLIESEGLIFCEHTAWGFWGAVWFQNKKFHEEVMVYGNIKKIVSCDSLEELMHEVNKEFGSE